MPSRVRTEFLSFGILKFQDSSLVRGLQRWGLCLGSFISACPLHFFSQLSIKRAAYSKHTQIENCNIFTFRILMNNEFKKLLAPGLVVPPRSLSLCHTFNLLETEIFVKPYTCQEIEHSVDALSSAVID